MQTRAALRRAQAASALSSAAYMILGTTELMENIFDGVPAKDLIRARRACKRFDDIITSDTAPNNHKLKTFLHPSLSPPTDHTIWKHMPNCLETWQPYIGTPEEAKTDFRARPILAINPAFASFEMPPKSESNVYGFENANHSLRRPCLRLRYQSRVVLDKNAPHAARAAGLLQDLADVPGDRVCL